MLWKDLVYGLFAFLIFFVFFVFDVYSSIGRGGGNLWDTEPKLLAIIVDPLQRMFKVACSLKFEILLKEKKRRVCVLN